MGAAGCGKTTVGERLAQRLNAVFLDADDYHPPANVAKMQRGYALTDTDRWPWLAASADAVRSRRSEGYAVVLACSALKRAYRQALGFPGVARFVIELRVSRELLAQRLAKRSDHFFDPTLLDSQLAIREPAQDGLAVAADGSVNTVVQRVLTELGRNAR